MDKFITFTKNFFEKFLKKQQKPDDSQQANNLTLNNLPKELLIEIFNKLKYRDICSVTLTCKEFNEIVSSSASLMDKFHLKIDSFKSIDSVTLSRRYRKIKIYRISDKLLKLLRDIGRTIWMMKIYTKNLDLLAFKKILMLCPNLKHLQTDNRRIYYIASDFNEPLPKLNLDYVSISFYDLALRILANCRVKRLFFQINCVKALKEFLKKQEHLECIGIIDYIERLELFDESLLDVDFKLKQLILYPGDFKAINGENFRKFLESQVSLKEIKIISFQRDDGKIEIMNILSDIRHIKKLHLNGIQLNFKPMPQIETLTLQRYFKDLRKFQEKFPNVTNLTIAKSGNLKVVKKFRRNHYNEIIISKVTSFCFHDCIFDENPFNYDDIKFDHLTIFACKNIDWLPVWLKNDKVKLKSLKILRTPMKKSWLPFIESLSRGNEKRIHELVIDRDDVYNDNIMGRKNYWEDDVFSDNVYDRNESSGGDDEESDDD